MLSNEQRFLLEALSDFVNRRKTAVPGGLDISSIVALSLEQDCSGIIEYQTGLTALAGEMDFCCYRMAMREKLLRKIDSAFRAEKIPYIIEKGPETAKYYPIPALRSMGDLDIMVHPEDKKKAYQALLENGCTGVGEKRENLEWFLKSPEGEIELHHGLIYSGATSEDRFVRFSDSAWENAHPKSDGSFSYILNPEYAFVYLLIHLQKHLLYQGAGIRLFMDIALMIRNGGLDWDVVTEKIRKVSIEKFAGICFALIARWFGVEAPNGSEAITEAFAEQTEEDVLGHGVSGKIRLSEKEKNLYECANRNRLNKTSGTKRLRDVLSGFFPPYSEMRRRYPDMPDCKALLPVMWCKRFGNSIRRKNMRAGLQEAMTPLRSGYKEEMEARVRKLSDWGIETDKT